jgi:diaminopimelate epimerase
MGNPHAVIFMQSLDQLESLDLNSIGPRLERNKCFPQFANIEFACVLEDKTIRMRVWERGVGITMACGSGACATLVAASKLNKSSRENKIILDGGTLFIEWLNNGTVTLSGDTEKVYEGIIGN